MKFRRLNANEIDARVATVKEKGLSLLLYKDARVDQNILDETVGSEYWQRNHELINGNLFCNVGIYIKELNQWVWKQDVGVESYTEKEKGQASDAFKRACFNWGIGRELYTAPFIWIDATLCEIKPRQGGGFTCYDSFDVTEIGYDDAGNITQLAICNKGKEVYRLGGKPRTEASMKPQGNVKNEATTADAKKLTISDVKVDALMKKCNREGVDFMKIIAAYKIKSLKELTESQHSAILLHWEEAKQKWAVGA